MKEATIEQRWNAEGEEAWCIIWGGKIIGFGPGPEGRKCCETTLRRKDKLETYDDCPDFIIAAAPALPEVAPELPWDMPTNDHDVYMLISSKVPEGRVLLESLFKKYADLCFQAIADKDALLVRALAAESQLAAAKGGWIESAEDAYKRGQEDILRACDASIKENSHIRGVHIQPYIPPTPPDNKGGQE